MKPEKSPQQLKHKLLTVAALSAALACGAFAAFSFLHQKLYSPIGVLVPSDQVPSFYIGISIYITIGVTLLTSALIRIALDLSK
ncbi:hypothetical protein QEH56_08055 [Pelagicoccus enzymogenes]|uniref:hypothetical protein n=1 Tax=Pelagicoccus enzymogenes TaxID=2773457 RepID=UPI00280DBF4C|nr:hypothetical protein [Pelagicoccus enzymogenes]MDQ8198095.1 hypothetical protein [Pelagicoccus enzymogenes]